MDNDKMMVTLQDLNILAATADRNGTQPAFMRVALQWAEGANDELTRLRAELAAVQRDAQISDDGSADEIHVLRAEVEALRDRLSQASVAFEREQSRADAAELRAETAQASRGELLEALRVVVRDWTDQFERNGSLAPEWCKQARAAIAKAEGGSNG